MAKKKITKKKEKGKKEEFKNCVISEIFGKNVFDERKMKKYLPEKVYKKLLEVIRLGLPLPVEIADSVAEGMKKWAIENGATHYTHWFQPLTGSTAEKHDSFIKPEKDGSVIFEFSGKQLIKGEPDASSFPSGGLRATFEARGYTAWDCTSPAFLKEDAEGDKTLCIPTAFYSYNGQALDKKIPLLRSMEAVSKQALRVLRVLGNKKSKKVTATVGPEQEYFLIDKELYFKRPDLIFCGRTLFGAPAPKGHELEDHYFGPIKDRVSDFMTDLDLELWKMGITSKTRHNEVAPAQFEMAPLFTTVNIGTDQNQLVMELMQKIALRHNLVCLLHEKPYAGVNGSGKHNNWSLMTDDGINLLDPGHTPSENAQFLLFLSALIMAVDKHADILRASAATPSNDLRLGGNEAPPAIISVFLGDELTDILEKITKGEKSSSKKESFLKIGVDTLPEIPRDNTDRNRTSPFAFTGNKFEFRMVGSSMSLAGPNIVLNTIVAEALDYIAEKLEKADDINEETQKIVKDIMEKHGRIIFNGNNYSKEWEEEAKKRGLPNIKNGLLAHKNMIKEETIKLFEKYKVLSKEEILSRYEIYTEEYAKKINIEARTALFMSKRMYIPAGVKYAKELSETILNLEDLDVNYDMEKQILDNLSNILNSANKKIIELEEKVKKAEELEGFEKAQYYVDEVRTHIDSLREDIDSLEKIVPSEYWPTPTYADMMFKL